MTIERLNDARKAADLTWLRLAQKAGISERHMRRLSRGEGNDRCTLELVHRLAVALEVRPAWLAFGEGAARVG